MLALRSRNSDVRETRSALFVRCPIETTAQDRQIPPSIQRRFVAFVAFFAAFLAGAFLTAFFAAFAM